MRRLARPVATAVALVLVASAAAAHTPDELATDLADAARERAAAAEHLEDARIAEGTAQERFAQAERQLEAAEAELAEVERALVAATARQRAARAEAAAARRDLRTVTAELAATEAELEDAQAQFDARVIGAFKRGPGRSEIVVIQHMLAADGIADALATQPFLGAVLEADRQLLHQIELLAGAMAAQRAEATRLQATADREAETAEDAAREIADRVQAKQALVAEVEARRASREQALEALRDDRASIEGHLAGLDAESARIEQQLAVIAAEQAARAEAARREEAERQQQEEARRAQEAAASSDGAASTEPEDGEADEALSPPPPPPPSGGWARPVPGPVTSHFGPRWGSYHNGVDLAGTVGQTVVASRAGTVVHVTAGCHPTSSWGCGGGFGNYVTVAHDNGMATIYAHLSSPGVGAGQAVAAGQRVGAVGNSGNSYGPHLHFEVREGGVPRNPCNYIVC